MKMNAIVKTIIGQINKIANGNLGNKKQKPTNKRQKELSVIMMQKAEQCVA